MNPNYIILITVSLILGVLPSLIWLFYYLSKDLNPEPKRMIMRVFWGGAFITIPVFFIQIGLTKLLGLDTGMDQLLKNIIYWFVIVSFIEELFKYLVFRIKVVDSHHVDEPVDVVLYMVIAALGFTAVENILYVLSPLGQMSLEQALHRVIIISLVRFITATLLHTLCSAIIGYSLVVAFYKAKNSYLYIIPGIILATLLHGLYNFSIIKFEGIPRIATPIIIILLFAFFVFWGFKKLKKMKSVCKTNLNYG